MKSFERPSVKMPEKNSLVEIEITDLTEEGNGIGRTDGGVCVFVPAAAPGDRIRAKIIKCARNYAVGKLEKVIVPSADRVGPDCPYFPSCGGCALRHISYEAELRIKTNTVFQNLVRIGGIDPQKFEFEPAAHADPLRYRSKAQFPFTVKDGKIAAGLFARHTHRVIPAGDCLLQPESFADAAAAVCGIAEKLGYSVYDEASGKGLLRHLFLRQGADGSLMICLVINAPSLPESGAFAREAAAALPSLKSVFVSPNTRDTNVIMGTSAELIFGSERITDCLCGLKFCVSPLSFFQVNRAAAQLLYEKADEYCGSDTGSVLDLYCGTGSIALCLSRRAGRVIGVESVAEAVRDARLNAEINGIRNAEFFAASATECAAICRENDFSPDTVITDPPRKGCSPQTLRAISELSPKRIVMVSCNSATAARDIKILCENGYRAVRAAVVDMFPRTMHVETVVLMSRKNA